MIKIVKPQRKRILHSIRRARSPRRITVMGDISSSFLTRGPRVGGPLKIDPQSREASRGLARLLAANRYQVLETIQACAERLDQSTEYDSPDFLLVLSLIADLTSWGAEFEIFKSHLYAKIPEITKFDNNEDTKSRIRRSLSRLKGNETDFEPPVDDSEILELLQTGEFMFERVGVDRPELVEIFRKGVSTWSMPYRTREGRSSRFVLSVRNQNQVVPVGILEIGDDAPHNPPRDRYMGFDSKIEDFTELELKAFADRFRRIRESLLPEGLPFAYKADVSELVPHLELFRESGRGRDGNHESISRKKRLTYLYRLTRAEAACRNALPDELSSSGFADGLRVLRDLSIPRTNFEMTICGALPPAGSFLVGKLVAGMAAHPLVRAFVDRDFGVITKGIFDTHFLSQVLPSYGALIVTTKGLYPGHSSQYNGVTFPSSSSQKLKLKKLGDTDGQTASHISDLTARFAFEVLEQDTGTQVSRVYGAGGAKRQRTIESGLKSIGLPPELCHARISRPVYGLSLVENLRSVILLNETPIWKTSAYSDNLDGEKYVKDATVIWRERWLKRFVTPME